MSNSSPSLSDGKLQWEEEARVDRENSNEVILCVCVCVYARVCVCVCACAYVCV